MKTTLLSQYPELLANYKTMPDDILLKTYLSTFNDKPKQSDRGFLIRHLYCKNHPNPIFNPSPPPITSLPEWEYPFPIPSSSPYKTLSLDIPYVAQSGSYLWLTLEAFYIPRTNIPLMTDYQRFLGCENCKGSGGGCPTYSPWFPNIKPSLPNTFIIVLSIDYSWVFKNVWKDRRNHFKNATLMFLMYPDRLTDNYLHRLTTRIKQKHNLGFNLLCGNCEGCRPKDCLFNRGLKCLNPSFRTFSVESTGIDCDMLHYQLYNNWLHWFFPGNEVMPRYISRYTCFLTNQSIEQCNSILQTEITKDTSYNEDIPLRYKDPDIKRSIQIIPRWIHKDQLQYSYIV